MTGASDAMEPLTVLVLAGGTGGHVYPGLAVAERLRERGHRVAWLGTREGLEARVVPAAGIALHCVRMSGLRGGGAAGWLRAPLKFLRGFAESVGVLRRVRPDLVLGMGGFVAGPAGLAAWVLRRPLVIHEQNAVPGLANRLLSPFASVLMEAFPGTFPPRARARHTGNPVRADILALPAPEARMTGRRGPLRLLVIGGSLGARALNQVVPRALEHPPVARAVEVQHQAGPRNIEDARAAYGEAGARVTVLPYIDDMAAAYEWADLVLCRAGAMTVGELAAAGAASILVPYPYAVDDHQHHNARYLSDAGAAVLVPQSELDGATLGRLLEELAAARDRLLDMARRARQLAVPDATDRVVHVCCEVAGG